MRPVRSPGPNLALAAALFGLLAGCAAQTLPGLAGDPQAPPRQPSDVPLSGSADGVVVEYYVLCDACTAQFTTPDGVETEPGIDGAFRRRVSMAPDAGVPGVSLIVSPSEGTLVRAARIRVGDVVRAESGRAAPGEGVNLYAALR